MSSPRRRKIIIHVIKIKTHSDFIRASAGRYEKENIRGYLGVYGEVRYCRRDRTQRAATEWFESDVSGRD